MSATVTVTGKIGPGNSLTATVLSNVTSFAFDCVNNILSVTQSTSPRISHIDINADTTITATKSGSTYTLTVS